MAALNYQTNGETITSWYTVVQGLSVFPLGLSDLALQHYLSVFSQNGGCGYVLKPEVLLYTC